MVWIGLAYDAYLTNQTAVAGFGNYYEGLCASYGIPLSFVRHQFWPVLGGYGPVGTIPIVSVQGDRNNVTTEMEQIEASGYVS